MRIATLQFAPTLGAVDHNISRANSLIAASRSERLDLLVLPELAFTGYNFPNLETIKPFLEPTTSGPSTKWAADTARRLTCHVIVGYPEIHTEDNGTVTRYNSMVVVGKEGEVVANYRKSFLYYTDETWASEGHNPVPNTTNTTSINTSTKHSTSPPESDQRQPQPFFCGPLSTLGNVGLGICMDINPHRFLAPWSAYEFATHMLHGHAKLIILSMAWLTRLSPEELGISPERPDMETVAYWLERFFPFLDPEKQTQVDGDVTVVFANRCGVEGNVVRKVKEEGSVEVENGHVVEEGDRVCYAGSSCVMKFQHGEARMFERARNEVAVMGKGEEGVLVVDTGEQARFLLAQKGAGGV